MKLCHIYPATFILKLSSVSCGICESHLHKFSCESYLLKWLLQVTFRHVTGNCTQWVTLNSKTKTNSVWGRGSAILRVLCYLKSFQSVFIAYIIISVLDDLNLLKFSTQKKSASRDNIMPSFKSFHQGFLVSQWHTYCIYYISTQTKALQYIWLCRQCG